MNRLNHFFIGGENFRKEFIKQVRLLIVVTIGFTIAFSWRQTTFDAAQTLVQKLTSTNGVSSSVLTSLFITLVGVLILILSSFYLKEKN
jgi:hypothetical protein